MMTTAGLRQRRLYVAKLNVGEVGKVVNWSVDGSTTGTALFTSTVCPLVQVMIQSTGSAGTFTCNGQWGLMFKAGIDAQRDGYAWVTRYDAGLGLWYTLVVPASSTTQNSSSVANRLAFVYAMGRGA